MRIEKIYCDRCGKDITRTRKIKYKSDSNYNIPVSRLPEFEICENCYEELIKWMNQQKEANHVDTDTE